MGVDTKIHLAMVKNDVAATINKIVEVIKTKLPIFGEITIENGHDSAEYDRTDAETREKSRINMYEIKYICFALDYDCDAYDSGKEQRQISIYYDHYHGGSIIDLSMGCWGHNEDIAKCLVDNLGGYADFSDCDSILIDYAMPQPKVKELQTN